MHCQSFVRSAVLALSLLFAVDSFACGESLFRVGKGVNYRNYFAPLPGRIVAVATTPGALAMVERLQAAGHEVYVVTAPEQVSTALGEHEADIVLALYSQRDVVESELTGSSVVYLPVAREATDEVEQAAQAYSQSLVSDDSVKQFLKTIHRTLKQREA